MLARTLRLVSVLWLLALAAGVVAGLRHGWSGGPGVLVAAVLFAHPASLLAETLLMARVNRSAGVPGMQARRLLRAWWGEWPASSATFGWHMPWREQAWPDHLPAHLQGRRGVVLVHGFICNRAVWNPLMAGLQRQGHPFIAVTLTPVFGDIDGYAAQLGAAVERLQAATGLPPFIVCHSMGGLVARAWLRHQVHAGAPVDVPCIVTIGTPHRGTWLARCALTTNGRQMRLGSAWLEGFADTPALAEHAARFVCWWSDCDQIVFPPPAAVLAGAEACAMPGVAHVALSRHPVVHADLLRRLRESEAPIRPRP